MEDMQEQTEALNRDRELRERERNVRSGYVDAVLWDPMESYRVICYDMMTFHIK